MARWIDKTARAAALAAGVNLWLLSGTNAQVRTAATGRVAPSLVDASGHVTEDAYPPAPLPEAERAYADISGTRMKAMVKEITAISVKSRDDGV